MCPVCLENFLVGDGRSLDNVGDNASTGRRRKTLINNLKQMRVLQCCSHTLLVVQLFVDCMLALMGSFPDRDIHLLQVKSEKRKKKKR